MARTPRKWQGARNPSGLKRVRQAERRHAILQPRRSAAKTLVAKTVSVATLQPEGVDVTATLAEAISALDRAAKVGAIHPNAAARRKSRLARKVNAALGGATVVSAGHVAKSTGKAAAVKAAKARIAAGKAVKAKGAQTAAGKARAALSRTTRAEAAPAPAAGGPRQGRRQGDGQGRAEGDRARPRPRRPPPRRRAKAAPKATAAKAPAKTAAAKRGRQGRRPEDHRRQGSGQGRSRQAGRQGRRPEDHQGEEGRVALGAHAVQRRPGQRPGRLRFREGFGQLDRRLRTRCSPGAVLSAP